MNPFRPLPLVGALLCLVLGSGCQVVQPGRPLTILACDAETHQPIPGARVRLQPIEGHLSGPDVATAGDDGIVRMHGDALDDRALGVEATAEGYMLASTFIPAETVRGIPPSPRFGKDKDRPVAVTVELYAGPRPSVDLIVPTGYHGVVKAQVAIAHDVPCPPHQRKFRFPVTADGTVRLSGPTMLERVQPSDFQIRYADETPVSAKCRTTELGFWWLGHDGDTEYFVVGDKGDYALARTEARDDGEGPAPHSGGRGGRGGHHRGGSGGGGIGGQ